MSLRFLKKRSGQAICLLLALLVAMAALGFWILDIHRYVMDRLISQDGGDAAALAAARWQAAGLNLCGELNLIQAYMLADSQVNIDAAQALHELRQRIQLTTPILAAQAAQLVAEQNDLPEIPEGTAYVREFRNSVQLEGFYEGADEDLRKMLIILGADPIRAVPMSGIFEDYAFYNLLLDEGFYEAILHQNWCFFYKNPLLNTYRRPSDFGPLPKMRMAPFFDLRLTSMDASLDELEIVNTLADQREALGHPRNPPAPPPTEDGEVDSEAAKAAEERYLTELPPTETSDARPISWTTYKLSDWGEWGQMLPGGLPIRSRVKDEYNYFGANIAIHVQEGTSVWLATAKPFGTVGEQRENPTTYKMVLGGFDTVRLIPVDATDLGVYDFNFEWLTHIRHHLQPYVERGKRELHSGCKYCFALSKWEDPSFRSGIRAWLSKNGHTCRILESPGKGGVGGTRYGH